MWLIEIHQLEAECASCGIRECSCD